MVSGDDEIGGACADALAEIGPVETASFGAVSGSAWPGRSAVGPLAGLVFVADHSLASSAGGPDEVVAAATVVEAVADDLRSQGGARVVIVAPAEGVRPAGMPGDLAPAAWAALARSLTRAMARFEISTNLVRTGLVDTAELRQARSDGRIEAHVEAVLAATALRRLVSVEEVVQAVDFLATDPSGYLTGAVLPVDGGLAMSAS